MILAQIVQSKTPEVPSETLNTIQTPFKQESGLV